MAKTLVDKVKEAVKDGDLDKSQSRHYTSIAKSLENYDKTVDDHAKKLEKAVGTSHKKPEEAYLSFIKYVAGQEKIKDVDELEKVEELSEDDIDKVRHHLSEKYGIPNEGELRKMFDVMAGGTYENEDEVRDALRQLAHRKGQHELSIKAGAWTSDKEWPTHAGKGGTHYNFMQMVQDHHTPEAAQREVDTYKRPEEAISAMGNIAQQAYQAKKEKRRKV
ncbi:hypothetical protein KY366_08580 [Candidatus Woesearchaeota archaeon]|nr:hypothetical protein [Candidatus Woesearchaeota archaeon]